MQASWEAELVLGDDFARHIKPLEGAYNSLLINLWLYAKAMDNLSESTQKPEEEPETAGEELVKKLLEPLQVISPLRKDREVDELSQTVNHAVSGLLHDLQKYLK